MDDIRLRMAYDIIDFTTAHGIDEIDGRSHRSLKYGNDDPKLSFGNRGAHMRETYITEMPDRSGAFLKASEIISGNNGNIVRLSYNKAVDVHTIFIEVEAENEDLLRISTELNAIGYLSCNEKNDRVIMISLMLDNIPGSVLPVLKILNDHGINISYMNLQENGTPYLHLRMGLLIENTVIMKSLLDEISKTCHMKILEYDMTEKLLDNTIFYIEFANEMRNLLSLTQKQTNDFIIDSNRIMQLLDEKNESPLKTFEYIRKFAKFVTEHKGNNFHPRINSRFISEQVTLHMIEPPCGSNIYILDDSEALLFIDSGFACFADEMQIILENRFPDFNKRKKSIIITHTDIDHTGLLPRFDTVYLNEDCYENFLLEQRRESNFREQNRLHEPYYKLSKMISEYASPRMDTLRIIGKKTDDSVISKISELSFGDLQFDIYEGNGGHIRGETIIDCKKYMIAFTGDIIVNIKGFSDDQQTFNKFAPYLMQSVNADSAKATVCRNELTRMTSGYLLCPGHGTWFENTHDNGPHDNEYRI